MIAVIGGSGFEKFDGFQTIEKIKIETPFGEHSSGLRKVKIESTEFLFLSRHGEHHELLPTEINYRANIFAFKKLSVYLLCLIISGITFPYLLKAYTPRLQ